MLEGFEAADALAIEDQLQMPLYQQPIFQLLHLQIVLQRPGDLDDLVPGVNVQLRHGQFSSQMHAVRS